MRFEKINGVYYIVLDENDKLSITTNAFEDKMSVDIECQNNGVNITGNSSIINTIKGDGMLEKVSIPPILSADEIVEKCNQWLEMFEKVHDKFRSLVLSNRYIKQKITMELSFAKVFDYFDKNAKCRKIDLVLKQNNTIIQEGVTISIDESNDKVFKYLLARVLEHYISVNYPETIINNLDENWSQALYLSSQISGTFNLPIVCRLSRLYDSAEYERIVTSIIVNHNLKQSSEQIIDNLKQEIYNQQISERFSNSINHSITQFEHIMADSDNDYTLSLKKTN